MQKAVSSKKLDEVCQLPTAYCLLLRRMDDNMTGESNNNRLMLGFIVRRCAREIGHPPSPEEFADWANSQEKNGQRYSLFGRPISPSAARIILRHPGRLVTARLESIVKSSS